MVLVIKITLNVQTPVGKNDVQSSDEENFMVVNVIPSGK